MVARARMVLANGLEFGLLEAGTGPLALCLHGFPDSAHTWRQLLPALAEAGFHAVAPFLRGYARPRSLPMAAMGSTPWPAMPWPCTRSWTATATPC
jgi:pimeloyl-ACP methyl ester carboxylesterase